jgi:hypothetical protein
MKVFFSMSFRGDVTEGREIFETIKLLGYKHTSNCFESGIPEMFYEWDNKRRSIHYQKVFKDMHRADIVVLESSIHSMTIGQMLQECLLHKKPILVMLKNKNSLAFLDGLQENTDRLVVAEYTQSDKEQIILDGLNFLKQSIDLRFTMLMDGKTRRMLDELSVVERSRSECIRQLVSDAYDRSRK